MGFILTLFLEFLVALLRILLLGFVFLIALLLWLWELLLRLLRTKNLYPSEPEEGCPPLPESIIRRPDPCLYSQELLMEQGVPVTWNNPDIWIAPASNPGAILADSYHLAEDTDYLVTVQVHNASTDAALGVRVRLRFRSWGFNIPDLLPVEIDGMGQEVSRYVDVAPMGSTTTVFHWHTPKLAPGEARHYCLLATLEHPLDVNTANNEGQENTNVYAANPGHVLPGETIEVDVPLHNPERKTERFRFQALIYAVEERKTHVLRLRANPGYRRWSLAQQVANVVPTLHPGRLSAARPGKGESERPGRPGPGLYRFSFLAQRPLVAIRTRYVGFDPVRDRLRRLDVAPPANMTLRADGRALNELLELGANLTKAVRFRVTVPPDARPGGRYPLTLVAKDAHGMLIGGVTLLLEVKE
jgi:hypothetical protein